MDEGLQSRRAKTAPLPSAQPPKPDAEEAIKALSAEIMNAYGLCRPLAEMQGRAGRDSR